MAYFVNYTCRHSFTKNPPGKSGFIVDRPWVEVTALSAGHSHRVWCLVDTGADDTILDLGTAAVLGINPFILANASVTTAGGHTVSFKLHTGITLMFAGTRVTAPVLFGVVAVPLLGRSALLAASHGLDAGFDSANWLHS